MSTLLISGGRVLSAGGVLDQPPVADILVEDGLIAAVGPEASARASRIGAPVRDAGGRLVTPGFVNAHAHSHDTLLRGCFEQMPLEVWGLHAFPTQWPKRSAAGIRLRTALHAVECLRGGITTVQDMVTVIGDDREEALAIAEAYEFCGGRAVVTPQVSDRAIADGIPFAGACLPAALLDQLPGARPVAGIARFLEALVAERLPPRLCWGLGPVQPQLCSDALLDYVSRLARDTGLRLYTHLYETRVEAVLARMTLGADGGSMVARLARLGLLDDRMVLGHGVWIGEAEIDRCGEAGAHLACNAVANLKLLNGLPPVRRYADAGVNMGLGCDNPSAGDAQDMFQAMKLFALAWGMQSPAGEAGAAAAAFEAATAGGARALGLGDRVGRIAPGYAADLVLFDLDDPNWRPVNSAVRQLVYGSPSRSVRTVLVGGEPVVEDGRALRVDEAGLTREAEAFREADARHLATLRHDNQAMAAGFLAVFERARRVPLDCPAASNSWG